MAVTWNLQKIKDIDELESTAEGAAKTKALLHFTMDFGILHYIGFGSITDKNKDEVFARICVMQSMTEGEGFGKYWDGENYLPLIYTKEDIEKRVGLTTNYTTMTHAAWMRERFMLAYNRLRNAKK